MDQPHDDQRSNFLSLPTEIRHMIYVHVPLSSLSALSACSKNLHDDIQPLISERGVLKISSQPEESGSRSYSSALKKTEHISDSWHMSARSCLIYAPSYPIVTDIRKEGSVKGTLDSFNLVLSRVQEIHFTDLSLVIWLGDLCRLGSMTLRGEIVGDGESTKPLHSFLRLLPNELGKCRRKLIVCCGYLDVKNTMLNWRDFTTILGDQLQETGVTLEELEIWIPRTSYQNRTQKPRRMCWYSYLTTIKKHCRIRIALYKRSLDASEQHSVRPVGHSLNLYVTDHL